MKQIPVVEDDRSRSLLDELDYIAAVSGGSFPAMHYRLYHDKSFETFPSEFLKQDVNSYIYGTYLLPWNCEWLVNPFYGTNDPMAELYDRLMFHSATHADLLRQGLPVVSVNATDIANGISFAFTQPYFDLLCSDRASFPVARAMDGGIADNLALRGVANGAIAFDESNDSFRRVALKARRVLVLSVDGQSATDPALSKERVVTGLSQIFGAVSGTQIDAYNFETLILTDSELRQLVESLRKVRCAQARAIAGHDCADVRGTLVHISLASIPDPRERQRLQAIPTGLTIPDADIDLLVSSGERLVQQNPKIRELISDLDQAAVVTARAKPLPPRSPDKPVN